MAGSATRADLDAAVAGKTIPTEFLKTVAERPDAVALRWKDGDAWREKTWREYADEVARVAGGLRSLGLAHGDRVVLMMRNRPEFHILDTAALMLGATPISIYNSSSPEQVAYLVGHCEAKAGIVEDVGFLERFLKVRSELPSLETLVVLDDPDDTAPDDVRRHDELLAAEPIDLEQAAGTAQPDDLATVIYTSGTTGPPKGVMLSHYNIVWTKES